MLNMLGISAGVAVAVAAYGEARFDAFGVMLQLAAVAAEATRLVLIQILLTSKGMSLNPITSLARSHIAPCCLVFLTPPWYFAELRMPPPLHYTPPAARLPPLRSAARSLPTPLRSAARSLARRCCSAPLGRSLRAHPPPRVVFIDLLRPVLEQAAPPPRPAADDVVAALSPIAGADALLSTR